ncbi:hypothetical protein J2S13_002271 [Oikeobacillus pervagus]|uniref:ATLF-like domain-containing protein n=1 Tax=Oikeobacillus pervagus TaxID=1325931 RepID=A0AAJ1WL58_9BACI|nr:toxin [Oikeobacillus pervagus]MDQ0215851.1 hypothetical protein [Oikeobacillus pervagus]
MRCIMIIVLILVLLTTPYWQSTNALDQGILLKDTSHHHSIKLRSDQILGRMVLLPLDHYDVKEAMHIISRIDQLPPSLLKKVDRSGIKIQLFTGKLTDHPTVSDLKGQTPRGYHNKQTTWDQVPGIGGSKLVLVKIGSSERGKGHGSINLELHELAHSIDRYIYNDPYWDLKFLTIWKKEVHKIFPHDSYFHKYPEEYFAEVFAMYYVDETARNELKSLAPETFHYILTLQST